MRTLIEGESLLNDGTAIVMVSVFIELCTGVELDGLYIVEMFSRLALGGIALGKSIRDWAKHKSKLLLPLVTLLIENNIKDCTIFKKN